MNLSIGDPAVYMVYLAFPKMHSRQYILTLMTTVMMTCSRKWKNPLNEHSAALLDCTKCPTEKESMGIPIFSNSGCCLSWKICLYRSKQVNVVVTMHSNPVASVVFIWKGDFWAETQIYRREDATKTHEKKPAKQMKQWASSSWGTCAAWERSC